MGSFRLQAKKIKFGYARMECVVALEFAVVT